MSVCAGKLIPPTENASDESASPQPISREKPLTLVENIVELKKMLVGVGQEVSGNVRSGGMEFFDVAQGQAISSYVFSSLFQHYRLYEYMFSKVQDEEIIGTDLYVDVAKPASMPFPPPLDEGVEEEKYQTYFKTPPSSPTPGEESAADGTEGGDTPVVLKTSGEIDLDAEVFTQLTPQDVREVVESVAAELLGGLQNEVAVKLREKENAIINKINKLHIPS